MAFDMLLDRPPTRAPASRFHLILVACFTVGLSAQTPMVISEANPDWVIVVSPADGATNGLHPKTLLDVYRSQTNRFMQKTLVDFVDTVAFDHVEGGKLYFRYQSTEGPWLIKSGHLLVANGRVLPAKVEINTTPPREVWVSLGLGAQGGLARSSPLIALHGDFRVSLKKMIFGSLFGAGGYLSGYTGFWFEPYVAYSLYFPEKTLRRFYIGGGLSVVGGNLNTAGGLMGIDLANFLIVESRVGVIQANFGLVIYTSLALTIRILNF